MSKIKKALEKLKSQELESNVAIEEKKEELQSKKIKEENKKEKISKKIIYTKTQIRKVSFDKLRENKIFTVFEDDPIADQFKILRTRILNITRQNGYKTIQVSSFGINEGKSLISANLAVAMAKETRQTTLLVDLDFRGPSIEKLFCLGKVKGLKDFFENKASLEELFINPGIPKLTILPAGGTIVNAPEILGSPIMEDLVNELKNRYPDRYIIFDTPGMAVFPDALILSEYVDSIILVARSGVTPTDAIEEVMEVVPKEKLIGIVLNDHIWGDATPLDYRYYYYYNK